MLEDPELVTLLPEEKEEEPPVSEDLRIVKRIVRDVVILASAKIVMVFAARRLSRNVRDLQKIEFPRQRYSD